MQSAVLPENGPAGADHHGDEDDVTENTASDRLKRLQMVTRAAFRFGGKKAAHAAAGAIAAAGALLLASGTAMWLTAPTCTGFARRCGVHTYSVRWCWCRRGAVEAVGTGWRGRAADS